MAEGDGSAFPWSLTPGGKPDPIGPDSVAPEPAAPIDRGHFEAMHSDAATPVSQPDPSLGHEDIETQEFATQRPAFVANPPYAPIPPNIESPNPPELREPEPTLRSTDGRMPPLDALDELGFDSAPEPAFPVHPDAGQPPAVDASLPGTVGALVAQPIGLNTATGSTDIESVFGASQFVDYDSVPSVAPRLPRPAPGPLAPLNPLQKKLVWVAIALVAAIALVGFYVVGTRIAPKSAPATIAPTASPSPAPSVEAEPLGPLDPGTYVYTALLGTECVEPFESAWQKEFTVVDCAEPHGAQLVARGILAIPLGDPYPGLESLDRKLAKRCASAKAINFEAAAAVADLEVASSFAANESEWAAGIRDYFCFASRSSGELIEGSIAQPDVAHQPKGE